MGSIPRQTCFLAALLSSLLTFSDKDCFALGASPPAEGAAACPAWDFMGGVGREWGGSGEVGERGKRDRSTAGQGLMVWSEGGLTCTSQSREGTDTKPAYRMHKHLSPGLPLLRSPTKIGRSGSTVSGDLAEEGLEKPSQPFPLPPLPPGELAALVAALR